MYLCVNFIVDNWQTLISFLFIVVGGSFALFQYYSSVKTKRAEFINQILEKLRFDKDLATTAYIFDYNQNWYNKSFHGSEIEGSIDKLLSYLDYICYLRFTKNITKTEFKVFQYKIHRACITSKIYLWNLHNFSKKNNTTCSFQFLIDYGIKNKLFPKDFKENTTLYNKTLNW